MVHRHGVLRDTKAVHKRCACLQIAGNIISGDGDGLMTREPVVSSQARQANFPRGMSTTYGRNFVGRKPFTGALDNSETIGKALVRWQVVGPLRPVDGGVVVVVRVLWVASIQRIGCRTRTMTHYENGRRTLGRHRGGDQHYGH